MRGIGKGLLSGRKVPPARQGFTLIELMTVLVIFSLIAVLLWAFLAGTFEVIRLNEEKAKLNNNARAALNQIAEAIRTASRIPRAVDRDRDGLPDDDPNDFGSLASWVIGELNIIGQPDLPVTNFQSEAFSDRLMLEHRSGFEYNFGGLLIRDIYSGSDFTLKIPGRAGQRVAARRVLFQLAIPADFQEGVGGTPYYMAPINSSRSDNMTIDGYPAVVNFGGTSNTAVLTEDLFYDLTTFDTFNQATAMGLTPPVGNTGVEQPPVRGVPRLSSAVETVVVRQQPVTSNITRIRFEYLHEVPVYLAEEDGSGNCQPVLVDTNGNGIPDSPVEVDRILVPIDVAENGNGRMVSDLDAVYDRLLSPTERANSFRAWNMDAYYLVGEEDREPPDFNAYLRCGAGKVQFAPMSYNVEDLIGFDNSDPALDGQPDGNADGIPDGDGIPDDPVPYWWVPYIKAIRVTLVATPTRVIEERRNNSGRLVDVDGDGTLERIYYKLDSPYPYLYDPALAGGIADPFVPIKNRPDLMIGANKDIIVTRTVRTENMPSLTPALDPLDPRLGGTRRADFNYLVGVIYSLSDFGERQVRTDPVELVRRLAMRLGINLGQVAGP